MCQSILELSAEKLQMFAQDCPELIMYFLDLDFDIYWRGFHNMYIKHFKRRRDQKLVKRAKENKLITNKADNHEDCLNVIYLINQGSEI